MKICIIAIYGHLNLYSSKTGLVELEASSLRPVRRFKDPKSVFSLPLYIPVSGWPILPVQLLRENSL